MPYTRKKRYAPKKKTMRKLNTRQKKEVKMILNKAAELKSYDPTIYGAGIDIGGTIVDPFLIPQGTGNSQRIGNDIEVSYMQFRYDWALADSFNRVRIIVFQWCLDDGTHAPSVAQILYTGSGAAPYNALYFHDNRDKFKILYDRRFLLEAGSAGSSMLAHASNAVTLKVPHKKILYNGGGVTTGRWKLFFLVCSDSTTATHPFIGITPRLVYRDI